MLQMFEVQTGNKQIVKNSYRTVGWYSAKILIPIFCGSHPLQRVKAAQKLQIINQGGLFLGENQEL